MICGLAALSKRRVVFMRSICTFSFNVAQATTNLPKLFFC
jgi:hypothetical protein